MSRSISRGLERSALIVALLGLVSIGGSGCTTDAYCFTCGQEDTATSSGVGGSSSGAGGQGQGTGGTDIIDPQTSSSSSSGAGGSGGCEADILSDAKNCGACGKVCEVPGAFPKCVQGACAVDTCAAGRVDLNGNDGDGCEYACDPSNGGVEICDGLDNDCDGQKDEGFDLTSDTSNCGACGTVCALDNATNVACSMTGGFPTCVVSSCDAGYVNLDLLDNNGCEYACPVMPPVAETCNGVDDDCDGLVDEDNPGGGAACEGACPGGECKGKCTAGTTLCTGGALVCLPGVGPSLEVCNDVDDDCDGIVDNGFYLDDDPLNCGGCGHVCAMDDAVGGCSDGACVVTACAPGHANLDGNDSNGCEYACPVTPPSVEVCNGIDDDCDGVVDNPAVIAGQKPSSALCYPAAGTPCAGADFVCTGTNGWRCDYGVGVEVDAQGKLAASESKCDGIDGNCNGQVDESFSGLNTSCDNGEMGACRDVGRMVCDPDDASKLYCDLSFLPDAVPGAPLAAELCNGADDDCDGLIDEDIVDDMVKVDAGGLSFYIDRFEASRPDATEYSPGLMEERRCVKENVLPWTFTPYGEAKAACEATGARLCTADEMTLACQGAAGSAYPYGASYDKNACNGLDFAPLGDEGLLPTGAPELNMCVSAPYGVHDLSGNAAEWTSTTTGTVGSLNIYIGKGGSYRTPGVGLTCGFNMSRFASNAILAELGFRCCKD